MYDVIIIGGGVVGCAAARELARFDLNICLLEKEEDVCCGTSKANSAIVHSGIDCQPGTLMAQMNMEGNELMESLSKELDFPFVRNGSLILCFSKEEEPQLQALYEQGLQNGVPGLKILDQKELHEKEPNVSEEAIAAIYAPTGGIVCPFGLTIALAENANTNGVEFHFNTQVESIRKNEIGWQLETSAGPYETRTLVNAAGLYADVFHNMVSRRKIHITPRRGEYCLLDKSAGKLVTSTIFQLPNQFGKGTLVTPTVHGNLLLGPTAQDHEDKEATNTTASGLHSLIQAAGKSVPGLPLKEVITSFSGNRAHEDGHEFIIEELADAPGFVDAAGIESPGLTSAPAIGIRIARIIEGILQPEKKKDFQGCRKAIVNPKLLSDQEYSDLIQENPAYGTMVCRCEKITEGEILDAIHRPLGAKSLDGIKRRIRAGMGRCQAGFCSPKVMEILARELNISQLEITKSGGDSFLLSSPKAGLPDETVPIHPPASNHPNVDGQTAKISEK